MKRIAELLLHLYPYQWRERYGQEFLALVEDSGLGWKNCVDVVIGALAMRVSHMQRWPVWRVLLAFAVAGGLVAAVVAATLPHRYVSSTVVGIASDTPTATLRRQISDRYVSIASRKSLHDFIQRHNLYERQRQSHP